MTGDALFLSGSRCENRRDPIGSLLEFGSFAGLLTPGKGYMSAPASDTKSASFGPYITQQAPSGTAAENLCRPVEVATSRVLDVAVCLPWEGGLALPENMAEKRAWRAGEGKKGEGKLKAVVSHRDPTHCLHIVFFETRDVE